MIIIKTKVYIKDFRIEKQASSKNVTYGSTYGTLPTATMDGYSFIGWFTGTGSDATEIKATDKVTETSDHTLYAHWELTNEPGLIDAPKPTPDSNPNPDSKPEPAPMPGVDNTYTVTFNTCGGSVSMNKIKVKKGCVYGMLPECFLENYYFDGWYTKEKGGKKILPTTIFNEDYDQILYARFDYIDVIVNQNYDVTKCFNNMEGIYKYKVESLNGGKAKVSKKGILKGKKPGLVRITPVVKTAEGKKLSDKSIVLNIVAKSVCEY